MVQFSDPNMTTGKFRAWTKPTLVGKAMSLLFNTLSRFVIDFFSRSKHLWVSELQSLSVVILEPKKIKPVSVSIVFPSICHEVMGMDTMILVFWMLTYKPNVSLFSFTLIKGLFSSSCFLPLERHHLHNWDCCYFSQYFWFQLVITYPSNSCDVLCLEAKYAW